MGFPEGSCMKAPRDSEFPFGAFFLSLESPSLISLRKTLSIHGKDGKAILHLTGGLPMSIFSIYFFLRANGENIYFGFRKEDLGCLSISI